MRTPPYTRSVGALSGIDELNETPSLEELSNAIDNLPKRNNQGWVDDEVWNSCRTNCK